MLGVTAAGGFVTGFTAGVANDMSFERALYRGMQAMGAGALGGALLGGLMYGVNELWHLSEFGDSLTYRDLPCLGSCATSGAAYVPSVSDAASPLYNPLIPPWTMSTVPKAAACQLNIETRISRQPVLKILKVRHIYPNLFLHLLKASL